MDICMVHMICNLCEVEKTVSNGNGLILPSPAYSSHVPMSSPGGQVFWRTALLHMLIINACAFKTQVYLLSILKKVLA